MTSIPCTALLDAFALFRRCIATRVVKVAVLAVPCTALAFALLLGTFLILVTRVSWFGLITHAVNIIPYATSVITVGYVLFHSGTRLRFRLVMTVTVPKKSAFTYADINRV